MEAQHDPERKELGALNHQQLDPKAVQVGVNGDGVDAMKLFVCGAHHFCGFYADSCVLCCADPGSSWPGELPEETAGGTEIRTGEKYSSHPP
jgi:hypothetical protein